MMAWEDPIVNEVRRIREQLMEDAGGFDEYIKKLRRQELEHPERIVDKEQLKLASEGQTH
jgi:hypothetical protein